MISFSSLAAITGGTVLQLTADRPITDLVTDSRKLLLAEGAVFFAIAGARHDAHNFIGQVYAQGIRQFVIERELNLNSYPEANFIQVASTLTALQQLASFYRQQFHLPVIGITGSNGKTIIKEWLFQLLSPDFKVVKNPGSYNSQLGVPLSVWQLQPYHQLGIFEAGISGRGEMEVLENVIRPTIGLFTNLGPAHDEGFSGRAEKLAEKLKLFSHVNKLLYCADDEQIDLATKQLAATRVSWAFNAPATYQVQQHGNKITLTHAGVATEFIFPFTNKASIENLLHCVVIMLDLKIPSVQIQQRIQSLKHVPMRLELKQGMNNCQLIDDSYNNDLAGLQISLDFVNNLRKAKKTLVISDILQSGLDEAALAKRMATLIKQSNINRLIGIGPMMLRHKAVFLDAVAHAVFFKDTASALRSELWNMLTDEVILLKGARLFQFERIANYLQRKVHGTRMEIDLNRIVNNLNAFKSNLRPGVKVMAMVKAFAYGSGSEEIANLLQFHRVDYLGVAYADEGVTLRKNQITIPIMVMNATHESFETVVAHDLQPVLYNARMLHLLADFLNGATCVIHLELETGMHRLGIEDKAYAEVISLLKQHTNISVASIFTHLAAADSAQHDAYTHQQIEKYLAGYTYLSESLGIKPLQHVLNSSGIIRFKQYQLDMVRLGIGLYGINPTDELFPNLQPAATLKTVISQIKEIKAGDTVGYGRWGTAATNRTIATLAIGYADGFSRAFSRGKGKVIINGKPAPVIGNVCMDMTMVDITGLEAREVDEAIIFGDELAIYEVAASIDTIPYEILTNTSDRVKRIFFAESI
ncbi:MAG: bifunctional UDP-N-acetylmuramoyl-tripeptide:D-alanyl-D-alanine ligase/alanine racemase [Cytophagales bacterium]|nr:bifunctional UDP-N-acetylmuramoyl-tripeptide:D-alanyl-D-alanine ligase/alanine racemase [Cytophagales bacterium]